MVPQDDSHTGHQELGPGNLTVSKHPRQGRQPIGAAAGACKTSPADGVGHQYGGDTKREPGALRARHGVMGLMPANGSVNSVHTGTDEGGWLANYHRGLQAIGAVHAQRA